MDSYGRIYTPVGSVHSATGYLAKLEVRKLRRLQKTENGLVGKFVAVENAFRLGVDGDSCECELCHGTGNARPDANGNYFFTPEAGGGRSDRIDHGRTRSVRSFVQSLRFGELNVYYHIDRLASYLSDLVLETGKAPLPPLKAVVGAHSSLPVNGKYTHCKSETRRLPFEGAHYRVVEVQEKEKRRRHPEAMGEIHFGPGFRQRRSGALAELTGQPYRANSSHNVGIIYHEVGHHVYAHLSGRLGDALEIDNQHVYPKTPLDEGLSDYWAAVGLDSPYIWFWNHSAGSRRNLLSTKPPAAGLSSGRNDVHSLGIPLARALWKVRTQAVESLFTPAREIDRLVLSALGRIGRVGAATHETGSGSAICDHFWSELMSFDTQMFASRHHALISGVRPGTDAWSSVG